jgi:hypothetical protein
MTDSLTPADMLIQSAISKLAKNIRICPEEKEDHKEDFWAALAVVAETDGGWDAIHKKIAFCKRHKLPVLQTKDIQKIRAKLACNEISYL